MVIVYVILVVVFVVSDMVCGVMLRFVMCGVMMICIVWLVVLCSVICVWNVLFLCMSGGRLEISCRFCVLWIDVLFVLKWLGLIVVIVMIWKCVSVLFSGILMVVLLLVLSVMCGFYSSSVLNSLWVGVLLFLLLVGMVLWLKWWWLMIFICVVVVLILYVCWCSIVLSRF